MSKFAMPTNPLAAIAEFAAKAESTPDRPTGKHKGYLLKMTHEQHDMLRFVLEHRTEKSIQQMLDRIIWPEIERRIAELRDQDRRSS